MPAIQVKPQQQGTNFSFVISCPPMHLTVRAVDDDELNMWIKGLLSRATAWREKALASGIAAQRADVGGAPVAPSRSGQMLPRDSVVRGARPATPQSSVDAEPNSGSSGRGRSGGRTHTDQQARDQFAARGQPALAEEEEEDGAQRRDAGSGRRHENLRRSWGGRDSGGCEGVPAHGRVQAAGEYDDGDGSELEEDCDVVQTVEFHSDDSSDEGPAARRDQAPAAADVVGGALRNLADMLSSDEDEDDEVPAAAPPLGNRPTARNGGGGTCGNNYSSDAHTLSPTDSPVSSPPPPPRFIRSRDVSREVPEIVPDHGNDGAEGSPREASLMPWLSSLPDSAFDAEHAAQEEEIESPPLASDGEQQPAADDERQGGNLDPEQDPEQSPEFGNAQGVDSGLEGEGVVDAAFVDDEHEQGQAVVAGVEDPDAEPAREQTDWGEGDRGEGDRGEGGRVEGDRVEGDRGEQREWHDDLGELGELGEEPPVEAIEPQHSEGMGSPSRRDAALSVPITVAEGLIADEGFVSDDWDDEDE